MGRLEEIAKSSVRGGFYLLVGNITSLILLALASILVARLLGPENYGIYSISLVIPSLALVLIEFGVRSAVTRYTAKLRSEGRTELAVGLAKLGILFEVLVGVIATIIVVLLADRLMIVLNRTGIENYIRIASLLIVGQALVMTAQGVFLGFDRTEYNALTLIVRALSKLILAPVLIIGMGIVGALLAHILSYTLAGVVACMVLWHSVLGSSGRASIKELKTMINYGFPLYLSVMVGSLMNSYNSIVLTWFVTNAEIGNFRVATNFLSLVSVIAMPIAMALFPAFSKLNSEDREELRDLFNYSVKYTAMLIVPASVLVAVLSKELIYLVYGSRYFLSPSYLSVYAIYYLLSCIGLFVLRSFFNGVGDTRVTLNLSIVMALVAAVLTPTLTLMWRVYGVIGSIIIANFIALIYGHRVLNSKYGIRLDFKLSMRIIATTLIATIPALVLKGLISHPIVCTIACTMVYVVTYLTALPLLRLLKFSDISRLEVVLGVIRITRPLVRLILNYERSLMKLL